MPSYLQIENISKSYGPKVLFEHIGFNINEGDKIALIAPNGTGKTSLLRILAGTDSSDSGGKIIFLKDIRIAFLEQEYAYDPEATVWEQIISDSRKWTKDLDPEHVAEYELRIRQLLTSFGMSDWDRQMKTLSGGEIKRTAIVVMLASEADFYIMDEPTNHLDIDAIEFLENYLSHARCTLLMVTHDRYFLDSVANTVMEMDHGAVYIYKGDYQNYLEKRQERIDNYNAETDRVRNLFRRELEWMHASPCARTGKAKYRKNAFYELKDRVGQVYRTGKVDMGELGQATRLGTKIIDCKDLSFRYGDRYYLKDFTYKFQRYEKVGIVGRNGVGKTTFINLLMGLQGDGGTVSGSIERGESLNIGLYRQSGMHFDEDQTVLETVNDTHLLNRFLFPHDMLNNRISKLSGGEKRRLYLLTVLMRQPNLLVLDEPTNDLDIVTLNILEEYLKEFNGTLIIVSHDRHFLDRLVDHLFIFCGDGVVKDFVGSYSQYREYIKEYEASLKAKAKEEERSRRAVQAPGSPSASRPASGPRKLSYKEQRELEQLEKDIALLTSEKEELETAMNGGITDHDQLGRMASRFSEVTALLDEKETRWLELSI
ncbi:MAG: ABC-F family ATP-binding cassette domain-containing protein [Bacteroidales bacterium]|uniref:ABC-F family ATP-binding cassette domain-containing protein n=1 Tax=Candidatus Cryptobacteroides sp. TaxID=2952915 RepID=UPI002A9146C1|nr:ABC-F family ATP-binding cassette domain-containing protein [Candidatus Cryptobacteroides sp.]MCI6527016.1 ABC-F family ATP-binding cassette domain-containing protein [Bacteroidales bacterium]MDD5915247.1 ABC-F family ATP-binding cassette domain-containing protein [Bacteroidales bacterium]MDD7623175.1 ABC-F family ATP-binding cassette domain-containing protein [Bacteroidales bacterium]MDY5318294.1 ABC-F family ATP-binding cassette domain-containing protein [Candidatus Cryptobacteroides sp.]